MDHLCLGEITSSSAVTPLSSPWVARFWVSAVAASTTLMAATVSSAARPVNNSAIGPITVGLIYINLAGLVGAVGNTQASANDIRRAFGNVGFDFQISVSIIGGTCSENAMVHARILHVERVSSRVSGPTSSPAALRAHGQPSPPHGLTIISKISLTLTGASSPDPEAPPSGSRCQRTATPARPLTSSCSQATSPYPSIRSKRTSP